MCSVCLGDNDVLLHTSVVDIESSPFLFQKVLSLFPCFVGNDSHAHDLAMERGNLEKRQCLLAVLKVDHTYTKFVFPAVFHLSFQPETINSHRNPKFHCADWPS